MNKIILYYKFVPLSDPEMTKRWQLELCRRLGLKGRVIVSPQGINGTLGGDIEALRQYKREMNRSGIFRGIMYKWSDGTGHDFPRLAVKVRPELVAFESESDLEIDEKGVKNGGKRLKPAQLHKLMSERDDVVFFDGRNKHEAKIGRFKDAVIPNVSTSRDFKAEIAKPKYESLKQKPVVTYCTGGVRCEMLSALMKQEGFEEVYQLDGGIVKYGEAYGDDGLWEGKLYVFDDRIAVGFSDETEDIGECHHCKSKTSQFINCANPKCNKHMLICKKCAKLPGREFCRHDQKISLNVAQ